MADYTEPDRDGTKDVTGKAEIQRSEERRPTHYRKQPVRNRIEVESKSQEGIPVRLDRDVLPTKQQKNRPEKIEQDRRSDQRSERRLRRNLFRRQANCIVSKKHSLLPDMLSPIRR